MRSDRPSSNLERLKEKLAKDGLAARLVEARIGAGAGMEQVVLKKVIGNRLEELRKKHAGAADR
jgi:hypothetical protein